MIFLCQWPHFSRAPCFHGPSANSIINTDLQGGYTVHITKAPWLGGVKFKAKGSLVSGLRARLLDGSVCEARDGIDYRLTCPPCLLAP